MHFEGLSDHPPERRRFWNQIPQGYFISERKEELILPSMIREGVS